MNAVEPIPAQIDAAAGKWSGRTGPDNSSGEILFFRVNWRALPALRAYVDAEIVDELRAEIVRLLAQIAELEQRRPM